MFEFTIIESQLLNAFLPAFSDYVNKSFETTMRYISNPALTQYQDNERLILISVNKSVYQNLYSFLRLNDNHLQYAAFTCLENAVYAMRLYQLLAVEPKYLHSFMTNPDFSLDECEYEEEQKQKEYDGTIEEFSLKEFCAGVRKFNTFQFKNASISSQIIDDTVYLGLSCGRTLSHELQHEVRKNLIGAYLCLNKHTRLFYKDDTDNPLAAVEYKLYEMFLDYVRKFS